MSGSGDSSGTPSGTPRPADVFEDLWRQLGDSHQNTVQELEAKVSKLKKDRCLDAQRLEVFYNRNQQLKEQNKTLQDTINLLEERLRAGECDRCAVLEENLKNSEDQNRQLIAKLKNERNGLEDENGKLQAELQKLKASHSEPREASSPEHEEGFIPDSPVLSSSLPLTNKLRKRKDVDNVKHVRYAERPLPLSDRSIFCEPRGATKAAGKAEVLVPDTCELDAPPISNGNEDMEEAIAETCGLELIEKRQRISPQKMESDQNRQSCLKTPWRHDVRLKPYCSSPVKAPAHSLDSTSVRSPSLLPCVRRFSEEGSVAGVKRKKEEAVGDDGGVQERADEQKKGKQVKPEGVNRSGACGSRRSISQELLNSKTGTSSLKTDRPCLSPAFKKPQSKAKGDADGKKGTPPPPCTSVDAGGKHTVEHMWSMDPALSLSVYDSEQRGHEEKEEPQPHGDLTDTDCTWVSHSMLQRCRESSQDKSGLGQKANDSLDLMFDATACGEYKSFITSQLSQSQHCGDDDENEEEGNEEEEGIEVEKDPESHACQGKSRQPSFAHVAVIRKKDERRKLKGTTCKECEIFYAHLPEEEKQEKLSACSRHRFLYIPPCTPENFWEVGFPSTQTCIERGYIKEEKSPQARLRRRQPLNALFSPTKSQKRS